VFARTDIMDSPEVRELAARAVSALGLDFGAVDIAYCEGLPYVLEVNTAPGLHGTTLVKYVNAFRRYMGASPLSEEQVSVIMSQAGDNAETPTAAQNALASRSSQEQSATIAIPNPRAISPVPSSSVTTANATPESSISGGEVLLRLDKSTALKLKQLLSHIV
jgi:hypothetical protein